MDRLAFPLEWKLSGDPLAGLIEGYASVYGSMDTHGDVVLPGAFDRTLAERKASGRGYPPMYMQHGARLGADPRPVGVWTEMQSDGRGLRVAGKMIGLDTETGKYNLAQVRDGSMRGLSIGYQVPPGGASYGSKPGEPRRSLKTIVLHEVSIVDDPSNVHAWLDNIKSAAEQLFNPRELERDFKTLLSGSDAVKAVAIVKKHLQREAEGHPLQSSRDEDAAMELLRTLRAARAA